MRSTGTWIGIALAVGLCAGYWIGAAQDGAVAPAPAPLDDARPSGVAPPNEVPGVPLSTTPAQDGASVRDEGPTLMPLTGVGTIRGRVTDEAGDGVAGVVVTATPRGDFSGPAVGPGRAPPPERGLDEKLADAERRVRLQHFGRRRGETDSAGRYKLEGLASGPHRVEAWKAQYAIRAGRDSGAWDARPGDTVDFRARSILVAFVHVVGVDGVPAATAKIKVSADEAGRQGRRRFAWTPKRNWIELGAGDHWILATRGPDDEECSERQHIHVAADETPPEVTLRLAGRPGIRGQIVFPEPVEVRRLDVHAFKFEGGTPPDAKKALASRQTVRGRYDSRDGTYLVQDIEAGRYLLIVSFDGNQAEVAEVVDVQERMLAWDIELPAFDGDRYRVVRVLDAEGTPVRGASFSLDVNAKSLGMSASANVAEREDGSYYVSRWPSQTMPPGVLDDPALRVILRVTLPDRSSVTRVFDPRAKDVLDVRLAGLASVDLSIDGFAESGLAGSAVVYVKDQVYETTGMSFTGMGTPVTPEGRATLQSLQAGDVMAVLVQRGDASAIQVAVFPLRIEPGKNALSVRMPRLHDVRFEGAEGTIELKRIDPAGSMTHQFLRRVHGGVAVAHFVPPGHYEASARVDGKSKRVAFDVPAQTVVWFDG